MYELVKVSGKCLYINCPARIGVYLAGENKVYLVDSGRLDIGIRDNMVLWKRV